MNKKLCESERALNLMKLRKLHQAKDKSLPELSFKEALKRVKEADNIPPYDPHFGNNRKVAAEGESYDPFKYYE
jgi:hypothetical protein